MCIEQFAIKISQKFKRKRGNIVLLTVTVSKRLGLSCKYLRTHVRTLAVVSCAAKMTPMRLSAT
jgi:hypothetical protein